MTRGPAIDRAARLRVYICDRKHPHYGESGEMTGKIVMLMGEPMAEVALDNCKHGTSGCFVSKGQIAQEKRRGR
jgi:hypothetical protein